MQSGLLGEMQQHLWHQAAIAAAALGITRSLSGAEVCVVREQQPGKGREGLSHGISVFHCKCETRVMWRLALASWFRPLFFIMSFCSPRKFPASFLLTDAF